jgi:hypothetical protein
MYPDQELALLGTRKKSLQRKITVRRNQCAEAAARLARPIAWLDRASALWRRLSPLVQTAAVPLGLVAARMAFPRMKILRTIARWAPLAYGAVRGLAAGVLSRKS